MQEQIKELTLLLMYLTSWKERESPGGEQRAWKGYDFDVLNELDEDGIAVGSHKSKSVYLTEKGMEEAKKLMKKYNIKEE